MQKNLHFVSTYSLEIVPSIILVAVRDVLMLAAQRKKGVAAAQALLLDAPKRWCYIGTLGLGQVT